ncbi:MAG: hypothetical protein H0V01_03555 [Bacteroidetes bacterium]|nr:hypothetical protein [Bacteroidota bacterium]HET6245536.1 hypothetical protein [Bacteroidia bacterium]
MNKLSAGVTLVLSIILVTLIGLNPYPNTISWDVFGYYLYLPAVFIYQDLGLKNIEVIENIIQTYSSTSTFYQATRLPEGVWVFKYSMGMAVLYAPFFFISHFLALFLDYAADGFSPPYQWGLIAGSFFYTLAGLYFLRKVLLKFFNDQITAIALILIVVGTNYFHIVIYSSLMPHNFLFTLYTLVLWFTLKWHETFKIKYIVLCGIVCGLCILSRPSEIVCLLIPALWTINNKESFIEKIRLLLEKKVQILLFLLVVFTTCLPQLIYYKMITGKFLYSSYGNYGEGMEFLKPYTLEVLFSFRKGWFIYTPIMLFAIIGLFMMLKNKWKHSFAIVLFTIVNVYIVSSWSCWWYADSFGQRALMQSFAVLALPLGYFILWLKSKQIYLKVLSSIAFGFFILLNLFQTWQINNYIIHSSRMTFSYYLKVFGKTTVQEEDKKLLLVNRFFIGDETVQNEDEFAKTTLGFIDFEKNKTYELSYEKHRKYVLSKKQYFSGNTSLKLDSNNIFSPKYEITYKDLTDKEYAWIRVSAMIYPTADLKNDPASIVITFKHKWNNYKYAALNFENLPHLELNKWNKVSFDYLTPEVRKKSDNLSVYAWNRGKKNIYIDDLKIDVFEPKN